MASRRNAKQSDIEPMEKLAETGKVSPPKRTKIVKSKDTKSTKSTKSPNTENNNEIIETELETIKKLRTRNKANTTAKSTAKVQPNQEQTTKLKRVAKKSKPLTEDNLSSNDPNELVDETNNGISEKIPTKKTRAKKVPEMAGNAADINNVEDAKIKPNTRANKVEAFKDADSIPVDAKGKKKNAAEKVPKETKTKAKPVKKIVEKNESIIEGKKKAINTRAKTTENKTKVVKSTVNDEKKAKAQTTKKMRGQTDNVPDETEDNVEEANNSKPVKGKSRKTNKDNTTIRTNNSKKVHSKETLLAAINEEEKELETNKLIMEEEEEEEIMENESNKISKIDNLEKAATNTNNRSLNSEEDSVDLNLSGANKNNKNKMKDSTSDRKEVSISE